MDGWTDGCNYLVLVCVCTHVCLCVASVVSVAYTVYTMDIIYMMYAMYIVLTMYVALSMYSMSCCAKNCEHVTYCVLCGINHM